MSRREKKKKPNAFENKRRMNALLKKSVRDKRLTRLSANKKRLNTLLKLLQKLSVRGYKPKKPSAREKKRKRQPQPKQRDYRMKKMSATGRQMKLRVLPKLRKIVKRKKQKKRNV